MARAELTVAPEPVAEPIMVKWPDGAVEVVEAEAEGWRFAWLWREESVNRKLAEEDLVRKRAQISVLQRAKLDAAKAERNAHPERVFIEELFEKWREMVGKKRCKLTPARFDMATDRLAEGYSQADLTMAVCGVALAPFTIEGEVKNDWKTCMWDGEAVERYANRCPAEKRNEIRGTLFEAAA